MHNDFQIIFEGVIRLIIFVNLLKIPNLINNNSLARISWLHPLTLYILNYFPSRRQPKHSVVNLRRVNWEESLPGSEKRSLTNSRVQSRRLSANLLTSAFKNSPVNLTWCSDININRKIKQKRM